MLGSGVIFSDKKHTLSAARALAVRELLGEYRQSRMSLAWPLLHPLLYTLLFVVLRPVLGGGALESPWEFGCFVFIGFAVWQSWFEALRAQMDAIRKNKALVTRGEISSGVLFLATLLVGLAHYLPRLLFAVIAAGVVLGFKPLALASLIGFGLAAMLNGTVIGALLQPFATLSADLGKAIQSISLGIMISGAVFIHLPAHPPALVSILIALNPMGALLNAARSPLFDHAPLNPWASFMWLVLTLGVALVIPAFGRRALPLVVERMGS